MYTIYTNKVLKLHLLLKDSKWMESKLKIKAEEYTDVEHSVANFIDDSNSFISFGDTTEANHYINRYFLVLIYFYSQNKLLINPEKTNLIVISKPGKRQEADYLRIVTEKEDVRPKRQIRILGWETNQRLSMDTNTDQVVGKVKTTLVKMEDLKPYMNEAQ